MSQSRHSKSKQVNTEMVSDCASTGASRYGYDTRTEDKCFSKPSHMLGKTDNSPSSPSEKCLYDSGRTDSGFLSGAIPSEQSISSSDDLSSSNNLSSGSLKHSSKHYTDSGFLEDGSCSMRIDSGAIDCGSALSDQFSELNIKKTNLNDLNAPLTTSPTSATSKQNIPAASKPVELSSTTPHTTSEYDLLEYFGQDVDGDTQLHLAILQGFIEVVYGLIRMAPDPVLLDIPNDLHQTPMHLAVLTAQAPIVRALLVAGASPSARDRQGNTPLHLASVHGATECVRALLQPIAVSETDSAGLQYILPSPPTAALNIVDEPNYDGQLCVHLAAAGGHVDVLRHLIWSGANINGREGKLGRTALHVATERCRRKVFSFLLRDCPAGSVDLSIPTFAGHTAYEVALYVDSNLARELAARGASVMNFSSSSEESESDEEKQFGRLPCDGFPRRAILA